MLKGSTTPRLFTPPLVEGEPGPCGCGCALSPATSDGFSVIRFSEKVLRMRLMPWQKWLLIHMLELRPDGRYRFRTAVVLVARQNGKSTVSQVLGLWWLFVGGRRRVLSTAQDLDTAESIWQDAIDLAYKIPALRAEIKGQRRQNGKKALVLRTGEEWRVKATSRRAARGLSGDGIFLDELREHQDWLAWSAITKTMMARPNGQVICLSNAGDVTSVVLRALRLRAHKTLGDPDGVVAAAEAITRAAAFAEEGEEVEPVDPLGDLPEDDLFLAEWSAAPRCSVWDRQQWAQSNPALNWTEFGDVVTEEAMASAARDPEHVFRPENLCQWLEGSAKSVFEGSSWTDTTDAASRLLSKESPVWCGLDMSHSRQWTFAAFAGFRLDGNLHVEVVARRGGDEWVEEWLKARAGRILAVTGQATGAPISPTIQRLLAAWELDDTSPDKFPIRVVPWQGGGLAEGFGLLHDRIRDHKTFHLPQPVMDVPAALAVKKRAGDGVLLDRTASEVDIAGLVAGMAAHWLAAKPAMAPAKSAYEDRGLEVV